MDALNAVTDQLALEIVRSGTVAEWSRNHSISPQYVHDVLSGRRDPGKKILDALGYELIKVYVRKDAK